MHKNKLYKEHKSLLSDEDFMSVSPHFEDKNFNLKEASLKPKEVFHKTVTTPPTPNDNVGITCFNHYF